MLPVTRNALAAFLPVTRNALAAFLPVFRNALAAFLPGGLPEGGAHREVLVDKHGGFHAADGLLNTSDDVVESQD